MTLGFGGEALDQEHHDEPAENRRKDDEIAEPARAFADVRVIPDAERPVVERVVKEADQRAQGDGADAGHDADDQSERAENEQADAPLLVLRRPAADDRRRAFLGRIRSLR